jgi:hypothetical protein
MVQAESNTATGLTVVPKLTVHQVIWSLQRKLRHLKVPRSSYHGIGRKGGLNPSCCPPQVRTAETYRSAESKGGRTVAVLLSVWMRRLRWSKRRGSV